MYGRVTEVSLGSQIFVNTDNMVYSSPDNGLFQIQLTRQSSRSVCYIVEVTGFLLDISGLCTGNEYLI